MFEKLLARAALLGSAAWQGGRRFSTDLCRCPRSDSETPAGKTPNQSGASLETSRRSFLRLAASTAAVFPLTELRAFFGQPIHVIQKPADVSQHMVLPETLGTGAEEPLYMLTYDHGGAVLWGIDSFVKNLRSAVAWLERYPSFKIGLDNEAYTYELLADQHPQVLEELRGYLKRYPGRFAIGTATYGQPLSCFINEESNVRQLEYAREVNQRLLGTVPPVYAMSEHAMHSQIPQLLRGVGFEGALMRTHYQMYGYNPTFDEPIGLWTGLDGTSIPTVPTYKGEGAEFAKTTEDNWILTRYPGPECHEPLAEFRKKFSHIHPTLASRVDDAGLRREELVKEYEGNPGYRWILLEELLAAFPKAEAEFRTAPNDFVVRMPWGYCGNEIWNRCREAEVAVLTAERLAALALLLGGEGHETQLTRAWRNLLVAQHHDVQITGLVADAREFLGKAMNSSAEVADSALRYIGAQMAGGKTAQVTVFNPHSWPREEWVEADVPMPAGSGGFLVAQQNGRPVPCHLIAAQSGTEGRPQSSRLAIRVDLPGLACASYAVTPGAAEPALAAGVEVDAQRLSLRTRDWSIRLDPQGGVAEWRNLRTGRSVLRAGKRGAFFAGRIENRDCESTGRWSILPGPRGTPWTTVREEGEIGGIRYVFDLTVRPDSPRLDCHVVFHVDNQRIGVVSEDKRDALSGFVHEHKLRFKMFPALEGAVTGVRDVPFGVSESPDSYLQGIYWTALSDGHKGMAVFNRGAMGSVREADGGYSLVLAFAMYYIWRTVMLQGAFSFDFALWPFAGTWEEADLHRRALEYNFPLIGVGTAPGSGRLGTLFQPIAVDSPGANVSAMFPRDGAVHLRLCEHRGRPTAVQLRAPSDSLTEVDLAGWHKGKASTSLGLSPWQIRTVRIEVPANRDSALDRE
jgi:hypothetical protein